MFEIVTDIKKKFFSIKQMEMKENIIHKKIVIQSKIVVAISTNYQGKRNSSRSSYFSNTILHEFPSKLVFTLTLKKCIIKLL